jgi:glycerophosphoryl diester phosphodiesterase
MRNEGLSGIELDVSLTADLKLVVFHDLEFPATINSRNAVLPIPTVNRSDMCVPRLRRSASQGRFRDSLPLFVADDCPLLEDVLRSLTPATAGVVIELKYPTNRFLTHLGANPREDLVKSVLECLQSLVDSISERWIVISSFDPDIVWMVRASLSVHTNVTVVHNVWFGHENDENEDNTVDFTDSRNLLPSACLTQARLLSGGVALEAAYVLSPAFMSEFKASEDVPLLSYGAKNLAIQNLHSQTEISGFFIDNMHLIKEY